MKFCPIVPVCLLRKLAAPSRAHMVLAQYCELAPYFEFYRSRVVRGDLVILDNGAYEGETLSAARLLSVVRWLEPTVVVAPDKPGDYDATKKMSREFLKTLRLVKPNVQCMKVLHAADGFLGMFLKDYEESAHVYEWVGFSRLTAHYRSDEQKLSIDRRARFACQLYASGLWSQTTNHHALGMLDGNVAELRVLGRLGFASCDSSAPVWRGLRGKKLTDTWPDWKFDPEVVGFSKFEKELAALNLQEVQRACRKYA